MKKMKKNREFWGNVLTAIGSVMLIDLAGFIMWAVSGQIPADGFFVGAITKYLIVLIF